MSFLAEILEKIPLLSDTPAQFASPASLWLVSGIYLALLLLGLALNGIVGLRLLLVPGALRGQVTHWRRGVEVLRARTWSWRAAGEVLLILIGLQLFLRALRWLPVAPMPGPAWAVLCQGLGFHLVGIAALAWSIARRGVSWESSLGLSWRGFGRRCRQGLAWYLGILPVVFGAAFVYQIILNRCGYPGSIQDVILIFLESSSGGFKALLLLLAIGVAPLMEEALFRGLALPLLVRLVGVWPAITLTALGFAGIHFHASSLAPLFVLAMGFAAAYIQTRSLWVPILMHALFNATNLGLIILAQIY